MTNENIKTFEYNKKTFPKEFILGKAINKHSEKDLNEMFKLLEKHKFNSNPKEFEFKDEDMLFSYLTTEQKNLCNRLVTLSNRLIQQTIQQMKYIGFVPFATFSYIENDEFRYKINITINR